MSNPMMKCGHAANAVDSNGNPCCVICASIAESSMVVDDSPPDLTGRTAKCWYCKTEKPSNANLPFFEYCGEGTTRAKSCKHCGIIHPGVKSWSKCNNYVPRGDTGVDAYYCGCRGWD